ncbi:Cof-type HAD-IIB family hydrolase [Brevibacillus laterosporus]|uniref:Putative bifunctional phosphatase/peptidyl-prolyl cis-trans isomerase n=1 Tax=Brevibacillus laterosporus LMG 15441 TaxID=1042163 RepID=A0A075R6R8_BRELA|nr:Cof-type HAD-IIB family hydrolase [Brevibacillus laterosporus]HAS01003.1 Cof-type HAD-IIB family hydrolase [Brevibacillus sp.]AIG28297.1 putative bifunctional phosphatase/peptidyl-prolyl cis-trans isomerase [Brevibacillus laterosporus LMG 15441]ERM17602.1 phosphatase [Brevibacillus laterosporus PE36]RJL13383.1 Cof-type HAD-IIB family hydrolase [Brevibacillus laterosporus]TPH16768.1 Cof-type HAD-IIB family hydrolase [Brevibacillus laterosporus]
MERKIVFFDVDGTLLTEDKQLLTSTRDAVRRLRENGIYTAIASGRMPKQLEDICRELDIHSYVSINGQYVVFEGEEIYSNPIAIEQLTDLTDLANKHGHVLTYVNHEMLCANHLNDPLLDVIYGELQLAKPSLDPDFYKQNPIYQSIIFCAPELAKEYMERFPQFGFIHWHDYALDIIPLGSSKAVGIQKMLEHGHFSLEHTYAFGDGLNDLEMLETVGHGVAMGNAVLEAKQKARYVTASCNEDGIAKGLSMLGLLD